MTAVVHEGDNVEVLRASFPDLSVDLVVTSPPYGDLRDYQGFRWDFDSLRRELWRVLRPGGVVCWVVGDRIRNGSRLLQPERQAVAFADDGWTMHDVIVWNKGENPMQRMGCHQQVYETVVVAGKGKPRHVDVERVPCSTVGAYHPRNRNYRGKDGSFRERHKPGVVPPTKRSSNLWTYQTGHNHSTRWEEAWRHPAIFPERLAARCVRTWSAEGDTVLDPFAGSGTTLAVAVALNRKAVGIEISGEYAELGRRRVADAEGGLGTTL